MTPEAPHQGNTSMDLQDAMRLVRTGWVSIAVITAMCSMLAVAGSLVWPKTYESTSTGLVVTSGAQDLAGALAGDEVARSKTVTFESLATSRPVAEAVIDRLQLDTTPPELLSAIETHVPEDTVEIRIIAKADSPQEAAALANAWVMSLAAQVNELETTGSGPQGTTSQVTLEPLSEAPIPAGPAWPNYRLNLAIGLLCGLGLGLLYVFMRSHMNAQISSVEEIRRLFGVPVLGALPQDDRLEGHGKRIAPRFTTERKYSEFLEALRELRTNLSYVSMGHPPRVVVVTSPQPEEGKSLVVSYLAVAIASTGRNVTVVDGDLRQPVIAEMFGIKSDVGVTDVLAGRARVDEAVQVYAEMPNINVLGAGSSALNSAELLASGNLKHMLDDLAENTLVLVDSPPLLPATDAALLTAAADGAIIVATAQETTHEELSEALEDLRQVHGNVLGVIINRVPIKGVNARYYGNSRRPYGTRVHNMQGHQQASLDDVAPDTPPQPSTVTSSNNIAVQNQKSGLDAV